MTEIEPLGDRLLVKADDPLKMTKGGIVLPDNSLEKSKTGVVLAVGPGRLLDNGERGGIPLKEGDRVLFNEYAGTVVIVDKEKYLIMNHDEILGRLVEA